MLTLWEIAYFLFPIDRLDLAFLLAQVNVSHQYEPLIRNTLSKV